MPTHHTLRLLSLCFYYYLKHLLSLFNSYIYKYRARRGRGDGGAVRRASELKVESRKRKVKSELRGTQVVRKRKPYNYRLLIAKF
jgi:hypothetical protein